MAIVGSLNVMILGRVFTVSVSKAMYLNDTDSHAAGGPTELPDGTWQIILDGRLSEEESQKSLEQAMTELSRRFMSKVMN